LTVKLVIVLTVAGQEEILGVRDFDFPPRAGELLQIERHGETLHLHVDFLRHRIDKQGHMPHLVCSRR